MPQDEILPAATLPKIRQAAWLPQSYRTHSLQSVTCPVSFLRPVVQRSSVCIRQVVASVHSIPNICEIRIAERCALSFESAVAIFLESFFILPSVLNGVASKARTRLSSTSPGRPGCPAVQIMMKIPSKQNFQVKLQLCKCAVAVQQCAARSIHKTISLRQATTLAPSAKKLCNTDVHVVIGLWPCGNAIQTSNLPRKHVCQKACTKHAAWPI